MDKETQTRLDAALAEATPRSFASVLFNLAHTYERVARMSWDEIGKSRDADFAAPGITCRTFSIELLLKCILVAEQGPGATSESVSSAGIDLHGHKYTSLFDRLSTRQRDALEQSYAGMADDDQPPTLRDAYIQLGDDPFVYWRYVYERRGTSYLDAQLLTTVIDSMGAEAQTRIRELEKVEREQEPEAEDRDPEGKNPESLKGVDDMKLAEELEG